MAEVRMTKKDWFEVIRGIVAESGNERTEEINAFIDHEVELLNLKSSKTTETKTQKENMAVKETIREVLRDMGHAVTITEMQADERLAGFSNQKLSALVRQMSDVVKTTEKKTSYFALAE